MHFAELCKLAAQAVTQRAFGTQFIEQVFGLGQRLAVHVGAVEQFPPRLGHFLLGKQTYHPGVEDHASESGTSVTGATPTMLENILTRSAAANKQFSPGGR